MAKRRLVNNNVSSCLKAKGQVPGADPGGGRWGARPPLGWSFIIKDTLVNSIQAPVRHWAPSPERNPVSAPGFSSRK